MSDEPAPQRRRQLALHFVVAIAGHHARRRREQRGAALEGALQRARGLRLCFHADGLIHLAQPGGGQQWGTRIQLARVAVRAADVLHRVQVEPDGGMRGHRAVRMAAASSRRMPASLSALWRAVGIGQVVQPFAGVRVQEQEALGLPAQRLDQLQQRDVLMHIREIARVEAVAVLHGAAILPFRSNDMPVPPLCALRYAHVSLPHMKLQQLRFLATVAQSELNITNAAAKLYTTQPAVSKQLRQLEDELGFKIFVRHGRALSKVTPPGERVVECAVRVLREVQNIKGISTDYKDDSSGTLSIGTTHTQARYVLPLGDQGVPRALSQGAAEPAAGYFRADRRDGEHRAHGPGHRHRFRRAVRQASCCCPAIAGTAR